MTPLFELPELLTLNGDAYTSGTPSTSRGAGCSGGWTAGCCTGCGGGSGDGKPLSSTVISGIADDMDPIAL